jgi:hypothetical protein
MGACGGGGSGGANGSSAAGVPTFRGDCPDNPRRGQLVLSLHTAQAPRTQGEITWQLEVRNLDEDAADIIFPSGKVGDVVLERDGEEIYRWSRERMFTQSFRCFTLGPGKRVRLDLAHDQLEIDPGDYKATATLASQPAPDPATRTVTVAGR